MYLSNFSSVLDAVEWLSENTNEPWSWKNVIEMFSKLNPETVDVHIPIGTSLLQISSGEIQEYAFSNSVYLEVCNVKNFLEHILMGDDFESARASPLALVCGHARFRTLLPIPASAIRLKKIEIYQLAEQAKRFPLDPFHKLVKKIHDGWNPKFAALVQHGDPVIDMPDGAGPMHEITNVSVTKHKIGNRSQVLDAEIRLAKKTATDDTDYHCVWISLKDVAQKAIFPFTGMIDKKKGLEYENADGSLVNFSRNALRKRMERSGR